MKVGDMVLCKKDFILQYSDIPTFKTDYSYKVIEISTIKEYWKPYGYCHVIRLIDVNKTDLKLSSIPSGIFNYFFYTIQETRKLKLNKINGKV